MSFVSLGFPVFGKKKKSSTFRPPGFAPSRYTDAKVGGAFIVPLPLLSIVDEQLDLKCKHCTKSLVLLLQATTPFEHENIDRMLFIFACNTFHCSRFSDSVVAFVTYVRRPSELVPDLTIFAAEKKPVIVPPAKQYFNPFLPSEVISSAVAASASENSKDEPETYIFISKEVPLNNQLVAYPIEFEDIKAPDPFTMDTDDETGNELDELELISQRLSIEKLCVDGTEGFEAEAFENIMPSNINQTFYRFEKTISQHPWQVIRYSWDGSPLLAQDMEAMELKCRACASTLVFECQLMPALLHLLQTETNATSQINSAARNPETQHSSVGMEWATILVYSCARDCGMDQLQVDGHTSKTLNFSHIIVQHEP